jgi:hypothetical protein
VAKREADRMSGKREADKYNEWQKERRRNGTSDKEKEAE